MGVLGIVGSLLGLALAGHQGGRHGLGPLDQHGRGDVGLGWQGRALHAIRGNGHGVKPHIAESGSASISPSTLRYPAACSSISA